VLAPGIGAAKRAKWRYSTGKQENFLIEVMLAHLSSSEQITAPKKCADQSQSIKWGVATYLRSFCAVNGDLIRRVVNSTSFFKKYGKSRPIPACRLLQF
jgi:hypothetical protein